MYNASETNQFHVKVNFVSVLSLTVLTDVVRRWQWQGGSTSCCCVASLACGKDGT